MQMPIYEPKRVTGVANDGVHSGPLLEAVKHFERIIRRNARGAKNENGKDLNVGRDAGGRDRGADSAAIDGR